MSLFARAAVTRSNPFFPRRFANRTTLRCRSAFLPTVGIADSLRALGPAGFGWRGHFIQVLHRGEFGDEPMQDGSKAFHEHQHAWSAFHVREILRCKPETTHASRH